MDSVFKLEIVGMPIKENWMLGLTMKLCSSQKNNVIDVDENDLLVEKTSMK